MRQSLAQYTIRRLLLANAVIAPTLALLIYACDGNYYPWRKLAAGLAVVFGLPAGLAWMKVRVEGADRDRALRAALGLHCGLMAVLCTVPAVLWVYYVLIRHGPIWAGFWADLRGTVASSLVLVGLYGLGCFLVLHPRVGETSALGGDLTRRSAR